ncbi:MAG: hypothetical protein WC368_05435 [Candidatus Cloacimonadaceae bacterium]|jgi:flagellar biosynthesis protein FlhB
MIRRLPLLPIMLRHFATYGYKRTAMSTVMMYVKMLLIPLMISVLLVVFGKVALKSTAIDSLITVMAVFTPLLFTALISIHDTRQNLRSRLDQDESQTTKLEYLLEMYEQLADNTSFVLAVSILELIVLFAVICFSLSSEASMVKRLVDIIIIYLLQLILYHIVYVVERLSSLIKVSSR